MPVNESGSGRLDLGIKRSSGFFIAIVIFLIAVKVPAIIDTDIQPWDEGMYAARVNSIMINGDFLDQSLHSVGKFYSGSHPPLLIWLGYFASLAFGFHPVVLKLLMIAISLFCAYFVYKTGSRFFSESTGIFAVMIFAGNILFNVFSKRFQLDLPYVMFMLISFYMIMKLSKDGRPHYAVLAGLAFGLCLMSKILVGMFIPIALAVSMVAARGKSPVSVGQFMTILITGLAVAVPWHAYMIFAHGSAFTDYFFGFHLLERAFSGVEMNQNASGPFYYFNYLMSVIPFGIILLFVFLRDWKNLKSISYPKLLLWSWTVCGFIILTLFRTKLESYLLLVLPAVCLLIADYLGEARFESMKMKTLLIALVAFNILWFATEEARPELKELAAGTNVFIVIMIILLVAGLLFLLSRSIVNSFNPGFILRTLIIVTFISINIFYVIERPLWEYRFRISDIVNAVNGSGARKIVYVGTSYRYNPQFSYYFNGLDLGWRNPAYEYEFMDTEIGVEKVMARLKEEKDGSVIIVERNQINRADYPLTAEFVPPEFRLIEKDPGYELYGKP